MWFYDTWVYQIVVGALYGAVVGWVAKELLHWAEERKYVDRESFLVFAVALAVCFNEISAENRLIGDSSSLLGLVV
jgi:NhaP-type Na+/H+ or K+/H+ antiporter